MFLQIAKSRTTFYFEYIGLVTLLLPYQRPECCFKSKFFSCLDRDMNIFRDFQGPRPRRDIGMARPRHSKTCLETETRLETSSSERRLEVLRASCVGQPREMVNLFCAPLKNMTTTQRIEKALDRLRQRYGVPGG